jgi:hypothetical protein
MGFMLHMTVEHSLQATRALVSFNYFDTQFHKKTEQ